MGAFRRERRATGVVVLEHSEERRLVSYISDILVVEVVEAPMAYRVSYEGTEQAAQYRSVDGWATVWP